MSQIQHPKYATSSIDQVAVLSPNKNHLFRLLRLNGVFIRLLFVCTFLGAVFISGSGCSTASLMRFNDQQDELPEELSEDLKDKFEIQSEVTEAGSDEKRTSEDGEKSGSHGMISDARKAEASGQMELAKKASGQSASGSASKKVENKKSAIKYPMRRPKGEDPIWAAERQVYEVRYLGGVAGKITLEVLHHKYINDRKVYHVKGTAKSTSLFGLFYKINDTVESFFDYEGFFSHRFHLLLDESKQTRDALELNDSEKKQTFYWSRWHHHKKGYTEVKEFFPMEPFSQDSLSALYYIRTLPLKDGDVYQFPVVSEGKNWTAVVTVMGREMMKTPLGEVQTIRLKPETKFNGVLKKRGDSFIWLTDDSRRFLVRLEAKVKIGSIVAEMKDVYRGLRPVKY